MDYVTLVPGSPQSSRLGFGCGSVMGRTGRSESLRAIAAALDRGITHFDVARLYGYGEAEALLGEALRGRRDRVVIASKFGLEPPRAAAALRGLKPLAQRAVAAVPGLRPLLRAALGRSARAAGRFSVAAASASLDASLAALGTEYLDILFLHDCRADDLTPELADFLDAHVAAGKIRAYGVATGIDAVAEIEPVHGDRLIYQFGNSAVAPDAQRLPQTGRRIVAHSPFRGAERLRARLPAGQAADLHRLLLGYALSVSNVAVVLCSMLDPRHLQSNLAVAENPGLSEPELAAVADLARSV